MPHQVAATQVTSATTARTHGPGSPGQKVTQSGAADLASSRLLLLTLLRHCHFPCFSVTPSQRQDAVTLLSSCSHAVFPNFYWQRPRLAQKREVCPGLRRACMHFLASLCETFVRPAPGNVTPGGLFVSMLRCVSLSLCDHSHLPPWSRWCRAS